MKALLDREVLFFGGKGGVGKTTCAAATALAASRLGRRVLLVSTDPAHSTSDIFERSIGPEPTELSPSLHAMEIDSGGESQRYVAGVKANIATLFGHAILKEANRQIDLAATMPGAEEVALFDRMGTLIRGEDQRFDLIVFDTAPTGHTLRLIRMPELMEAWIRALSRSRRAMLGVDQDDKQDPIMITLGERLDRLRELRARLISGRTTGFVLVLIPERLPIEETARTIVQLDESGVRVGALVVNRVLPAAGDDPFLTARRRQEGVYLNEIAIRFQGHRAIRVPQLESDVYGMAALDRISTSLFAERTASSSS
jgi:arsenite/tail-anchored protein-transporting ATPase